MKLSILSKMLLVLSLALCGNSFAQRQSQINPDTAKPAVAKKAVNKIVGPLDKAAADTQSAKAKPALKPVPKPKTAAAKNTATMGQGAAVMMKEKSEPPPPKKDKAGDGGPKDPKPKKGIMMKDKAALQLSPGQSQ